MAVQKVYNFQEENILLYINILKLFCDQSSLKTDWKRTLRFIDEVIIFKNKKVKNTFTSVKRIQKLWIFRYWTRQQRKLEIHNSVLMQKKSLFKYWNSITINAHNLCRTTMLYRHFLTWKSRKNIHSLDTKVKLALKGNLHEMFNKWRLINRRKRILKSKPFHYWKSRVCQIDAMSNQVQVNSQ